MDHLPLLRDLVVTLAAALVVVFAIRPLKLPPLIGFIATGVLIGPYGLRLISQVHEVELLAEIGVTLLLFSIGLEFSIATLRGMWRQVVFGGGLQVGLTVLVSAALGWGLGLGPARGIFWGFLIALSSTAITLKILGDRREIDTPAGRLTVGMLLFQDLAIVPMVLLVPLLGGAGEVGPLDIAKQLGIAVVVVTLALVVARRVVPRLMHRVASLRSREVFVLTAILLCFGAGWITQSIGLSLSLGAFLAGIVISENDYAHQVAADTLPLRDLFAALFFVSIGMLLDVRFVVSRPFAVAGLCLAIILLKSLLAVVAMTAIRRPLRVSVIAALSVAQIGEFSFVLARLGQSVGMLTGESDQLFLAAAVVTMMLTPFIILLAPPLAFGVQRRFGGWVNPVPETPAERAPGTIGEAHAIIVGFGPNGLGVAEVLRGAGIPYDVLDLNGQTVRRLQSAGERAYYGDISRPDIQHAVGIESARLIVFTASDPAGALRGVRLARRLNPTIRIVARTRYSNEVETFRAAGADTVVVEETEVGHRLQGELLTWVLNDDALALPNES